jgi:hypothetical protein
MAIHQSFGWVAILVGFVSGMLLGLGFQRDDFLGGYGSLRRRMLRLGHVALIALGILNLEFARTLPSLRLPPTWLAVASAAMIAGAVTMPLCCALMAWRRTFRPLFAVPVTSLLLGAGLVVAGLVRP